MFKFQQISYIPQQHMFQKAKTAGCLISVEACFLVKE